MAHVDEGAAAQVSVELLALCFAAFLAGFVDAAVGGGGLIQLPALMLAYPEAPLPVLFGTNKLASIAGTSVALVRYALAVSLRWSVIAPAAALAFIGSFLGARAVSAMPTSALRPVVLLLLVAVAVYTLIRKDLGAKSGQLPPYAALGAAALGAALGFYDGFFGPGTGSFFIFALVGALRFGFLEASASAKLLNVATNLAALAWFLPQGQVWFGVALPMALCNILGSTAGARVALSRGSQFVRQLFLIVVTLMVAKLGYEWFG